MRTGHPAGDRHVQIEGLVPGAMLRGATAGDTARLVTGGLNDEWTRGTSGSTGGMVEAGVDRPRSPGRCLAGSRAVGRKNRAPGVANADLKQINDDLLVAKARAEAEYRRALVAARAAFEQNRSVVDTQREILGLLEDKLRFVPALQEVREKTLDLSTTSLESAAASMNTLRTEIGWPPVDEELNRRTLARAYQRLGELSLSRNQLAEAIEAIPTDGRDHHAAGDRRIGRPGGADPAGQEPASARVPRPGEDRRS
jgi:hypothetical protein